ncbi:polysaccharide deacetylase family protein [Dongshaea marina]|uniref:polysaccharide deacetylase family protein n=1 Tax=Dongshaea marina TaxID=2047966 RepID=UPI000D3E71B5|nr:polysaccharide deacetylase family protein [Dongshaea marina]
MNILMALSQLEITGAEVYATTIGDRLTELGHNVSYVSDTLTMPHQGQFFGLRFNKRSLFRRFWHVGRLIYLIKKHKIQLVHAHSRASSWSCQVACKLIGVPLITTVHGRQPVHKSRKLFRAMGDRTVAVCEAIAEQLIRELEFEESQLQVIRNGVDASAFTPQPTPRNSKPIISIVGRLTGPKGEVCYRLLDEVLDLDRYQVQIISGSTLPDRFKSFLDRIDFAGHVSDIPSALAKADLVIGAGRVAIEALLMERPTVAIGEAFAIGHLTLDNIQQAMTSNFGDIGPKDLQIDFQAIKRDVENALASPVNPPKLRETVLTEYELEEVTRKLEYLYQSTYVRKHKREMPIIMYHRVTKDASERGVHGTWVDLKMLEKHFKLIKKMGFETITFEDLKRDGMASRLAPGRRSIMLTFDDGFADNYHYLLPLLKKYNFKAVIYAVTGEVFNRWDVENPDNPEKRFELMTREQVKEMDASGLVEFGGHTQSHPRLSQLTEEEQIYEIETNKKILEQWIGKPLNSFAYPYGDLDRSSKLQAQKWGYPYAVATNSGPLPLHEDLYQIRRIAIFPRTNTFGLWRKIHGNYTFRKEKC